MVSTLCQAALHLPIHHEEEAMFRGFFRPEAVISSPEGYAVVLDSGYCSCNFCVRQNTPVCIVQGSAFQLVLWNNRHRYFYARLYWTKYARADFVETVSGGIAGEFHIFLWKRDLACRDQLSSLWRQSADFTLLAGVFDATDIHGDRVCLTLYVHACGGVCCGIANGSAVCRLD